MNDQIKLFLADWKKSGYSAETLNKINEERKKQWKWIQWRDQFYSWFSAQKTEPIEQKKTFLKNVWWTAKALWLWSLAWWWVGKIFEWVWTYIYKNIWWISPTQEQTLQIKEWRTPIQKILWIKPEWSAEWNIRTTTQTALERWWIFKQVWWSTTRATTATQTARRVWNKEVSPILNSITDKFSLTNIRNSALKIAGNVKNKFTSASYRQWVDEVFDALLESISQNKYLKRMDLNNMSANDVQQLRSHIMKMDIPASAYRWTTLKDSYKQWASTFIKALKKSLTDSVAKAWWDVKKFERAYIDYWNLVDLAETSAKKAWTLPSQNLQQMISSTTGKPLSSLSTFVWKWLYKVWKWLEFPAKLLTKWVKQISKIASKWLKAMSPTLKSLDPTWTLFNIIENEIEWKWLKWYQINDFTQLRLMWLPAKEAAKEAKKSDPNKFTIRA